MEQVDREANDRFVFLASPISSGGYGVTFYPELPEIKSQIEVSKGRLRVFLIRHRGEVAVEDISATGDLFVSAVTADEVRELMGVPEGALRGPFHA